MCVKRYGQVQPDGWRCWRNFREEGGSGVSSGRIRLEQPMGKDGRSSDFNIKLTFLSSAITAAKHFLSCVYVCVRACEERG